MLNNEVIAVFQDRRSAGSAIANLVLAGFEHEAIDVRMSEQAQERPPSSGRSTTSRVSPASEMSEGLIQDLRSHGVAEYAAQRSAEEIEQGGVLVIVDVGDDVDHDRESVVFDILRCAGGDHIRKGEGWRKGEGSPSQRS
jgi:hypothetical protein